MSSSPRATPNGDISGEPGLQPASQAQPDRVEYTRGPLRAHVKLVQIARERVSRRRHERLIYNECSLFRTRFHARFPSGETVISRGVRDAGSRRNEELDAARSKAGERLSRIEANARRNTRARPHRTTTTPRATLKKRQQVSESSPNTIKLCGFNGSEGYKTYAIYTTPS